MVGEALPPRARRGDAHQDPHRSARTAAADAGAGSDVRLTLPARAENVAIVRHVLAALGDALQLPDPVVADMRLAVTEACTNVVRHAYGARSGVMDVLVRPGDEAMEVVVSDTGGGMGPSVDTRGPGLGLPLIAALADGFRVEHPPVSGSRLVMTFRRKRTPVAGAA